MYFLTVSFPISVEGHMGVQCLLFPFPGHSMGGRVGMILALTHPGLIDKLVVVDATPVNTPLSLER